MIINPIWFYLIDIVVKLGSLFVGLGATAIGVIVICVLANSMGCDLPEDWKKLVKKLIPVSIIFFTLHAFTPGKETCYQMMTASLITKENIEYIGETGKGIIDYIVESIDILIEENEPKEEE